MTPKESAIPHTEIVAGTTIFLSGHEYTVGDTFSPEELEEKRSFILSQRRELAKIYSMFAIQCQLDDGMFSEDIRPVFHTSTTNP